MKCKRFRCHNLLKPYVPWLPSNVLWNWILWWEAKGVLECKMRKVVGRAFNCIGSSWGDEVHLLSVPWRWRVWKTLWCRWLQERHCSSKLWYLPSNAGGSCLLHQSERLCCLWNLIFNELCLPIVTDSCGFNSRAYIPLVGPCCHQCALRCCSVCSLSECAGSTTQPIEIHVTRVPYFLVVTSE